jgi:hypothetical protein
MKANKPYPTTRSQEVQDLIDQRKAQFKKNSEEFAKQEPIPFFSDCSHASPAPRKTK